MKLRICFGLMMAAVVWGQDAPGRVGRLSFLHGSVSFRPDAVEEWAAATLNYSLTTGDRLWTDREAQAEVQVGLTSVRMAPETALLLKLLDDRAFRMELTEGALNIRIPRMNEGETVAVETPYGVFRLLTAGSYRVDMQPESGYAAVIVRSGTAEAVANGQPYAVPAGKRLVLAGKPATVELLDAPPLDPWDEWCAARDEQIERNYERSAPYVSWEISGAADFADYGEWYSDPDYGWCWIPHNLPAGWAPYRFGHWMWRGRWGWTWVDRAPWGFATHHFGRWTKAKRGWAWRPDPERFHPKYSPANVEFSRREGRVAWIPIGPRDIRHRDAVTVAAERDFAGARPIDRARLVVVDRAPAPFSGRRLDLEPTREAVLGGRPSAGPTLRKSAEPVADVGRAEERRQERIRRETDEGQQEEARRRAEEARHAEERQRDDEQRRRAEEHRRAADERRRDDEQRQVEENRRQIEERRRDDEQRRLAEEHRRQVEERRRDDEQRRQAEEHRRAAEQRRRDDEQRQAEERRRDDEQRRQAEEHRRQAQERRRDEEQRRQADEQRRQDDQRRLEEGRRAEEHRRQAEESQRQQEEHRRANEGRKK